MTTEKTVPEKSGNGDVGKKRKRGQATVGDASNLKRPKQTLAKPICCHICFKSFGWKSSLTRHVKTMHGKVDTTATPAAKHAVTPPVSMSVFLAETQQHIAALQTELFQHTRRQPVVTPGPDSASTSAAEQRVLQLEHELARGDDKIQIALRDQQVSHLMQRLEDEKRRSEEVTVKQAMTGVLPFVERITRGALGYETTTVRAETMGHRRGNIRQWSPEQVGNFLKDSFVSNYSVFVQEDVCGRELALFTVADLMQPPFSLRKRKAEALLDAIADVKNM